MRFETIRTTAAKTGISSYTLRKWLRENRLPGFHAGNRFMVDTQSLIEQIDTGVMDGEKVAIHANR